MKITQWHITEKGEGTDLLTQKETHQWLEDQRITMGVTGGSPMIFHLVKMKKAWK